MKKNILNKVSTLGVVAAVATLVVVANPLENVDSTYGYGSAPTTSQLNLANDPRVNGESTSTEVKPETPATPVSPATPVVPEVKDTLVGAPIEKELNGKKYSYLNGSQHVTIVNKLLRDGTPTETKFTDIASTSARESIMRLERAEVVKGTTPTTYEPNRAITRAEYLAIVLGAYGYDLYVPAKALPFSDVNANSWQARVVSVALENGVVSSANSTFRPDAQISKIEALAILYKLSGFSAPATTHSFVDAAADWQNAVLAQAEYLELVEVPADKKFNPNAGIARADMAELVVDFAKLY